ncbi:MAG: tetratricopeptide repeat protein, partial [Terriglobia bacterium]
MAFNKAKALQEAEKLVIQGKISQAIKRYFDILERDPSDVILLNTIGDLYIRDRNASEGLKQFYRLAEAYVRDGFILKAIAIYKKIVKLEPDSVDPLLKLAELYQTQRLAREARELYYQVAESYKKKKQNDKVLETLRKAVQLDVENAPARVRLAAFCEEIGRKEEATQVYLETAQLASRRGDLAAAQVALNKVQELDPQNPQIHLLRAREALATKHPEEVEAILSAIPGLKDDPTGRSLLIDSYLSTQQLEKAEKLVPDLFRANPTDFSPVASFVSACVQVDEFDAAFRALSGLADELIKQENTSSLLESLRLIWNKSPQHLPTLELIYRIYDERAEEYALPEILEALGHAYVQGGQFEKAEQAFQRLVSREPANERYKVLLKQVLKKQGKEVGKAFVAGLPSSAIDLTREEGLAAPAAAALADAERVAVVKQALDNSELFARYHLVKKAVTELDRVLEIYPDEPEIHKRLVGMCWKAMSERAEQAAQALVRIYTQQGDAEEAKKFAQLAGGREAPAAEAIPPPAVRAPALRPESLPLPSAQPASAAPWEIDLASGFSLPPVQEPETAPTPHVSATASAGSTLDLSRPPEQKAPAAPPAEIPSDFSVAPGVESPSATAVGTPLDPSIPPAREAPLPAPLELSIDLSRLASPAPPPAPTSEIQEIDLSEDWESFQAQAAPASRAPETPRETASFNYEDSRIEVNFYLESGFLEEAIKAVEELERTLPGEPRIAELRALVEAHTGAMAAEVPEKQPAETLKPTFVAAVAPPAEGAVEQLELASSYAAPKTEAQPAAAPPISPRQEEIPTPAPLSATPEATTNLLGDLAETPQEAAPFNYEDSRIEVNFYLESGFLEEAIKAVEELERTQSGEPRIAELRALVEAHTGAMAAEVPEKQPAETLKPTFVAAVAPPAEGAVEQLELASSYAAPKTEAQPAAAPPISPRQEEIPTPAPLSATPEATTNLLGDLADAFGSAMGELAELSPPPAPPSAPTAGPATISTAPAPAPASPLGGLLEEMSEALAMGPDEKDDPETHYNLGVAFREMNLLDEAIGEFQKVVKGAGKRPHPPNYLQACSLLATCFMDKGMAPIAVKWYCRALETPDLDEEALLALQYDLGVAYEQAGDAR